MKSAVLALCVIVALGILSTPDYVVALEQANNALRTKLAKAQNAQLQCRETLVAVSGESK